MDIYERVYHRDGYRCVYCGRYMLSDFDTWQSIHTDHLVPLAKGGDDSLANLVTSCPVCNTLKGSFVPEVDIHLAGKDAFIQKIREFIYKKRGQKLERFFRLIEQMNARYNPVKE